jgi:hypothetical protein
MGVPKNKLIVLKKTIHQKKQTIMNHQRNYPMYIIIVNNKYDILYINIYQKLINIK